MKKTRKALVALMLCALLMAVCHAEAPAEDAPVYDATVSGWHIAVEDAMVRQSMQNVTVELGYTDVSTDEFVQTAPEGKLFCLVKLYIEKAGSKEKIEWEKLTLTDAEGNVYSRIEDNFIEEMGMKRMPGTPLNFGASEGWIAFEIDEAAEGLVLSYLFEAEGFECPLEVEK